MTERDEITELAVWQAALLELLASGLAPAEIRERLLADPLLAGFRGYAESLELRALEVACELSAKWGRRGEG